MLSGEPAVVAELASSYGQAVLGPDHAVFSRTHVAFLRQRGGHDGPSRLAAHALGEYERRNIAGRIDGLYHVAATRQNPALPRRA